MTSVPFLNKICNFFLTETDEVTLLKKSKFLYVSMAFAFRFSVRESISQVLILGQMVPSKIKKLIIFKGAV